MSRSRRGEPVKVVIINTEYVETDAMSFKSVVQRLTGKDAPPPAPSPKNKLSYGASGAGAGVGVGVGVGVGRSDVTMPMLKKGMSFRDLDKLLLELPTMDDIYQLYID
ncbi:putative VQ motif-containing protein 1/10 [Helianthus annuus]|uniref:Putative VQ motif-containing protein n=1 Tax=Helianthus annuus TaxID=4232 RepID=A0A251T8F2_HELAN|nr:VQ motif-containing protein 1 [Helianthus annuus]KAF5780669.1 putative VQ motif-containing protein 1/10 [Helianthus annuus]KAJ0516284.1 putative VQ motif-containing protein [Helianthus annuus]KAJ0684302.1 putative VQ motif-containing protein [Helianthus annuus]KAJ0873881.1 putative VQ motif-containing protein [Helianthus annuus]